MLLHTMSALYVSDSSECLILCKLGRFGHVPLQRVHQFAGAA